MIVTEIGGIWNVHANNFLIPVQGIYFFQLNILANNNFARAYIRKDSTNIQQAFSASNVIEATATVILEVEALTQMSGWLTHGKVHGSDAHGSYTHFNGFMIFPM